ncbi:MAG TPA: anthranilate phosphoribosyltransferase [Candidatus Dormibacteraeota bacterium]|nr:anthranilate phosphoribosyltransferase [Candidatus Dormibacteraeota bacterium]
MAAYPDLLRRVLNGGSLSAEESAATMGAIVDGTLSSAQAAGILVGLAARGETIDEVIGAARAMRQRALRVEHDLPLVIDIVGTGGDGSRSINISTAAALVVAGAGVPVAKHGNRAASSACGSADVLEALGVPLNSDPSEAAELLTRHRIAFLFAPRYHPAFKAAAAVRSELGVRTIFNLLGPLCNPARAQRQLVGVFGETQVDLVAEALQGLGAEEGAVVHSASGMDEVAGEGPTSVAQFNRHDIRRWSLNPEEYGIRASLDELRGGDPATNAALILAILRGEPSPRADVVALNAALALVVAGSAEDVEEGLSRARRSISDGAAMAALEALRGSQVFEAGIHD